MIIGWELFCLFGSKRSGEVDIFLRPFPTAWLGCCGRQPVNIFIFSLKNGQGRQNLDREKENILKIEMEKFHTGYFNN